MIIDGYWQAPSPESDEECVERLYQAWLKGYTIPSFHPDEAERLAYVACNCGLNPGQACSSGDTPTCGWRIP